MRFSVGVNYWPRTSGLSMWTAFDAREIDEDFARIAALGLDTVRVYLRWDVFAPHADALDSVAAERFDTLLGVAARHGLRVMPVLFCGYFEGAVWLPRWALDRTRPARLPVVSGDERSAFASATLYAGALLDAQLFLARALGERVRDHPAIAAWDIGNAFSFVDEPSARRLPTGEHSSAPVSEATVADWSRRLARTIRAASGHAATASIDAQDLLTDRSVRLGSLFEPLAFASLRLPTLRLAFARSRLDADACAFLTTLAAGFASAPVLVTALGNPTCPPHKFSAVDSERENDPALAAISPSDAVFADYACLTEAEQARLVTDVLERLHADGRLGAYWWSWSDMEIGSAPPFDRATTARTGLVRTDGSSKPVAEAIAMFARQAREVRPAEDHAPIAAAYYYRTLPTSTRTLYDAYLGSRSARPER